MNFRAATEIEQEGRLEMQHNREGGIRQRVCGKVCLAIGGEQKAMFDKFNHHRRNHHRLLGIAAITLAFTLFGEIGPARAQAGQTAPPDPRAMKMHPMPSTAIQLPVEGNLPSLRNATAWLNSAPLTAAGLRGKVVLVEFWTYSCINWRRQLPYVRAWAEKYKDQGLVVVGVHAPEFSFEKNIENVRRAAKEMRIDYPIALDNDHAIWRDFNNEYWPALYFIDAQGRIRHHQFGEGEYEQSELIIQQLLTEAGIGNSSHELVSVTPEGAEVGADWNDLRSAENYVGYERTENFASSGGARPDKSHDYASPAQLKLNHWALSGDWTMGREAIVLNKPHGHIVYSFHDRDLHLVMGPAAPGTPVRFRVLIDGQPPGAAHGADVDEQGNGTVSEPRMYQLIRQPGPIIDRRFEIEFLDSGVQAFSFTFG
jgi:thiol-disulfide isomerase/thioredoxin